MLLISNALVSSSGFRHRDKERRVVSIYDTHNKCASFSARLTALWRNSTGCACLYVYVTTAKKHLLCHICTKQCAKWLNTVQTGQICLLTLNTTHTHTLSLYLTTTHTRAHTHTLRSQRCSWMCLGRLLKAHQRIGLPLTSTSNNCCVLYVCEHVCVGEWMCAIEKKKENK